MKLRLFVPFAAVLAALAVFMATPQAQAPTLYVDDDYGPPATADCPLATFKRIKDAVAAATIPGTIISVCDGVYTEQVVVPKTLTLQAAPSQTPEIHYSPSDDDGTQSIVRITGGASVTVDGFIIKGPGPGCSLTAGIRVDGGASATITQNLIADIRD